MLNRRGCALQRVTLVTRGHLWKLGVEAGDLLAGWAERVGTFWLNRGAQFDLRLDGAVRTRSVVLGGVTETAGVLIERGLQYDLGVGVGLAPQDRRARRTESLVLLRQRCRQAVANLGEGLPRQDPVLQGDLRELARSFGGGP